MEITKAELLVIDHLVHAWNAYLLLPQSDAICDSTAEFRHLIHKAQDHVAARAAWRWLYQPDSPGPNPDILGPKPDIPSPNPDILGVSQKSPCQKRIETAKSDPAIIATRARDT